MLKLSVIPSEIITNTRIFEYFDGSIEVVLFSPCWVRNIGSDLERNQSRCQRGTSENYEQNHLQAIKKAKTKVRRLIFQYGFKYLYTIKFGADSLSIVDGDRRISKLRRELKKSCSSFKDYILTRSYDNNLLYYKLLTNVFIYEQINTIWEQGSFSFEHYGKHLKELHQVFTDSFDDKRFVGYNSYSVAKGTTLVYQEEYFPGLTLAKNYIGANYPGMKKVYERKYLNGKVTNLFYE